MRRTPRLVTAVALLAGASLVAAACGNGDDSTTTTTGAASTTAAPGATTPAPGTTGAETTTTAAAGPAGGTITYAAEQEITSYNNGTSDTALFAGTLVLNPIEPSAYIVKGDGSVALDENVVTKADVKSASPQVIEYTINPKAVWSDGEPVSCKDFYLAWLGNNGKTKAADGKANAFDTASTTGYEQISKVDCSTDGKTATTTYETPYSDWKALFSGMLPAHVVEKQAGVADITKAAAADLLKAGEFWTTGWKLDGGLKPDLMPSAGPYTLDSFTAGESLTLKRNDKFWGKPAQSDTIVFKQVPDATAQPQALANNEVQVISPQPNEDLVAQVKQISDVNAEVQFGFSFEHFDFNLANPILKDLAVRQAFALCINRQEMVDTLLKPLSDKAAVLNSRIFFPFQKEYKDNSGAFGKQDIAKAKSTLEADGWVLGGDGIYAKGGQKLSFRIGRRDPNPRRQKTIALAQAECKEAGFDLQEQADPKFNSDLLPASQYDVALFAWVGTPFNSSNASIYQTGGGQNWNNYSNPKLDELFKTAASELDDAKRADLYNQADQTLWADMVTIPLFQFADFDAYKKNIENVVYNPSSAGITWNVQEWKLTSK